MIDIDHFKTINDTFGHPKGDEVLVNIAKLMRQSFRKTDAMFRVGGEEFLVLLNASSISDSQIVADRFRESVQDASIIEGHQVTLSIGVKGLDSQTKAKDWLAQCDKLLYSAKQEGRNRVVFA